MCGPPTDPERALGQVTSFRNSFGIDHSDHNINRVFFEALEFAKLHDRSQRPVHEQSVKPIPFGPARDVAVKTFARFDQRREDLELSALRCRFDLSYDCAEGLFFHR